MSPESFQQISVLIIVLMLIWITFLLVRTETDKPATEVNVPAIPNQSKLEPCLQQSNLTTSKAWGEMVDPCPLSTFKQCTNNQMYQAHPYDAVCAVKPERDNLCQPRVSVRCLLD